MPFAVCDCGTSFPADAAGSRCPQCSAPLRGGSLATGACPCGQLLIASDRWIGRDAVCPACGTRVPMNRPEEVLALPATAVALPGTKSSPLRWLFAIALLPLLIHVFKSDDLKVRLERALESYPEAKRLYEKDAGLDEILEKIPGHRIEGAYHARGSHAHWLYAPLSLAAFAAAFVFLVPPGRATRRQLGLVVLFTGTAGITLLLSFQQAAFGSPDNIVSIFIVFSYVAAGHPKLGFVPSLIGFTFGVGLLEELVKALPIIWKLRRESRLDVRGVAAWGVASGIGFGVYEAMHYSSEFYHGLSEGGIYVVRFVSCVALHAVWAGTFGILAWRRQEAFRDFLDWAPFLRALGAALAGPMILHALYDTLLKGDHNVLALTVAAVSFAWFLWLYGRADAIERTRFVAPA